jgi:hypothetical protein
MASSYIPEVQTISQDQRTATSEKLKDYQERLKYHLGYQGQDVGSEYVITIVNLRPWLKGEKDRLGVKTKKPHSSPIVIRALLQEKIDMSTQSDWAPLTAASVVTSFASEIAALGGRTLVNRWISRRIWRGTSPIEFTLNLRFEAENDAMREVLMPCKELQRMALPFTGDKILGEFFLSPPGPSPIQWGAKADDVALGTSGRGEIIDVKIGNLLYIRRCVVKRINVSYFPRFEVGGNPLGAVVSVNFETFEISTKETLDTEVYNILRTNKLTKIGSESASVGGEGATSSPHTYAMGPM